MKKLLCVMLLTQLVGCANYHLVNGGPPLWTISSMPRVDNTVRESQEPAEIAYTEKGVAKRGNCEVTKNAIVCK